MDINYDIFRERLRNLRDGKGLNSQALADYTGLSAAAVSRYINGSRHPDLAALITLADFFDVRVEWLVGMDTKDRYDDEDPKLKDLTDLYSVASDDDKAIVDMILSKYRK